MATPDPSTLTSSADIFSSNHTLPQIRSIHKSLHVAIDEKSTRLRTQVGSSYRELLGTADTIVQMRGDNEAVQALLGNMGGRCGRAIVGAKASGLAGFVRGQKKSEVEEAARVKLLDGCGIVVGRILKGGGGLEEAYKRGDRLVLAAKVLVLSRLLTKSLGGELLDGRLRQDVEAAKKTLSVLRRRLLRNVDKVLDIVTTDEDREDVLKALCAYSLATSSGARDVLRHFLHVRQEAMATALELEEGQREKRNENVIRSLRLYTRSLLDVQALVPTKMFQALSALKSRRLLADPALKQLSGLRLDIYERWCGEEIQCFTPFIRHDDLDGKQARDMLMGWVEKGGEVLLDGVKATLEQMKEFKSIMELRTSVLQVWIRDGGRARGFDPSEMQEDLREAINSRMLAVLESKVRKLHIVGSEVKATLENWRDGITDKQQGLWDEDGYDTALSNGAAPFIENVVSRLYGRNDAVSKASHCYASWFHIIDDVKEVVECLAKQRWDNDFEEVEDEETIDARQQALSKDDPQQLKKRLDTTLDKVFQELDEQLHKLWKTRIDASNSGAVAFYLLRILRDIRNQLPERHNIRKFGLEMVPSLHETVAKSVSKMPVDDFAKSGLSDRNVVGRPLWDGEPALPSQPSPTVFEFLRNLSTSMGEAGMDLWSPAAVDVTKKHLDCRLSEEWEEALASVDSEEDNEGDSEKPDGGDEGAAHRKGMTEEQKSELYTQWLFDVSYLRKAVGHRDSEGLKDLKEAIHRRTELDTPSLERISQSAEMFWQRTRLLFGFLG